MVEFALILPLLLLLLFGITELGRALYQQNMFTQAVELGGRYMARVDGAVNVNDCTTVSGKWAAAIVVTESLINCGVDGTSSCTTPPILPNIEIDYIDVCGPTNPHYSCSSPSACVITLRATAAFQSIFGGDLISVPGYRIEGVELNASTQERYIGR